jgi:hypothetical protein
MHKISIVLFLVLFCSSCGKKPETAEGSSADSLKADSATEVFEMPTTALPVKPLRVYAAPFRLDSVIIEDSVTHYAETHFFPSSGGVYPAFDAEVKKQASGAAAGTAPFPDEDVDGYQNQVWVTFFSVKGSLVSVGFTWQGYTEGAAHFTHGYETFNDDLKRNVIVFFTDLFVFRNSSEKEEFCEQFSADWSDGRPTPDDLDKGLKFTLSDSLFSVYFDDFEKGPSMCVAEANWENVRKYLKAGVAERFGLK